MKSPPQSMFLWSTQNYFKPTHPVFLVVYRWIAIRVIDRHLWCKTLENTCVYTLCVTSNGSSSCGHNSSNKAPDDACCMMTSNMILIIMNLLQVCLVWQALPYERPPTSIGVCPPCPMYSLLWPRAGLMYLTVTVVSRISCRIPLVSQDYLSSIL